MSDPEGIRWPARFHPSAAPIHVRNSMVIAAAPEAIWNALIAAPYWPEFYPNARDVILEDGRTDLTCGARFKWTTFGFRLETVVEEFEPPNRIAWRADGIGVSAYHAWLIVPHRDGSRIDTEETQHGWLARLGALFMPQRMWGWHQRWLEGLAARVTAAEV